MEDAVNLSPYRVRQRKRKELRLLGVYEGREEHYSEFQEQYWPSFVGKMTMCLNRRRWNGKIEVFFEKGK